VLCGEESWACWALVSCWDRDGVCFSVSADFLSLVDLVGTRVRNKLSFARVAWPGDRRKRRTDEVWRTEPWKRDYGTDKESWTLLLRTTHKVIDGQRTADRSDFFNVPNRFFYLPRFFNHHVLKPYY
jgi:hypothetical protein